MMRGAAVEAAQVDVGFGGLREALKKIFEKLNGEIADLLRSDFGLNDAVRAAAKVNCGGGERLVHRHQEISSAENSFFGAQRSLHRFSERDANVFNGVVLVDVEVASGGDGEIEGPVASDEIEHMIEEADAGGDFGFATTLEREAEADIGLGGFAMDRSGAAHAPFFQMR